MPARRLLGALLFTTGACWIPHASQERFAREFDCPVEDTKLKTLGAGGYRVRGCGTSARYVCMDRGFKETLCTLESERTSRARSESYSATRPSTALRRRRDESGNVSLETTLTTRGGIVSVRATASADSTNAVMTFFTAPTPASSCRFDVVINGARREVPDPVYGNDAGRFFVAVPLELLADMATAPRVVARTCSVQFAFDPELQVVLREFLMRVREEAAFTAPGSTPASTTPSQTPNSSL